MSAAARPLPVPILAALSGVSWVFPEKGNPHRTGRARHAREGPEGGKQKENHQGAALRRPLGAQNALTVEGTWRGWLLGADDLAKLGAVLRRSEDDHPTCVTVARLILLCGCRLGARHRLGCT